MPKIYGRSVYDEKGEGPNYVSDTQDPQTKLGSWTMIAPAVEMEDGLYIIKTGAGELSQDYEPLQKVVKKPNGPLEYRNMAGYPTPVGTHGLLVQAATQDEFQYLFFPIGGNSPIVADHETGKNSSRVFPVTSGAVDFNKPAGLHALIKIMQTAGGAFIPALNFSDSPDKAGFGAFVAKGVKTKTSSPKQDSGSKITYTDTLTGETKSTTPPKKTSSGGGHWEWVNISGKGSVMQAAVRKWIVDPPPTTTPFEETKQVDTKKPEGFEMPGYDKNAGEIVSLLSWERGGPIHPGHVSEDQHQFAKSGEIAHTSAHISTDALYFRNSESDGPLDFSEEPFPEVNENYEGFAAPVFCSWDNNVGHQWGGSNRVGKWRWWAVVPNQSTPPTTTTTTGKPNDRITTTTTEITTKRPGNSITTTFDTISDTAATIDISGAPLQNVTAPGSGWSVKGGTVSTHGATSWASIYKDKKPSPPMISYTNTDIGECHSARLIVQPAVNPNENSFPALLLHAVRQPSMAYDARFGEGNGHRRQANQVNGGHPPFVVKIQGFGKAGAGSKKWEYNQQPKAFYTTGTANGGIYFSPPEWCVDGSNTATMSTTAIGIHPDISVSWGTPQTAGTMADGPKLAAVGVSGSRNMHGTFTDAAGTSRDGIFKLDGLFHMKERAGAPTCDDGYGCLYIDTADSHAKIAWQDGATARTLDLGHVT